MKKATDEWISNSESRCLALIGDASSACRNTTATGQAMDECTPAHHGQGYKLNEAECMTVSEQCAASGQTVTDETTLNGASLTDWQIGCSDEVAAFDANDLMVQHSCRLDQKVTLRCDVPGDANNKEGGTLVQEIIASLEEIITCRT